MPGGLPSSNWAGAKRIPDRHELWFVLAGIACTDESRWRTSGLLSRRIRVPLQPTKIAITRKTILPVAPAGRADRSGNFQGGRGQQTPRTSRTREPQHIAVGGVKYIAQVPVEPPSWLPNSLSTLRAGDVVGQIDEVTAEARHGAVGRLAVAVSAGEQVGAERPHRSLHQKLAPVDVFFSDVLQSGVPVGLGAVAALFDSGNASIAGWRDWAGKDSMQGELVLPAVECFTTCPQLRASIDRAAGLPWCGGPAVRRNLAAIRSRSSPAYTYRSQNTYCT